MRNNIKLRRLALEVANKNNTFTKDYFICEHIAEEITKSCDIHDDPLECSDAIIVYCPEIREYGIPIRDSENSSASSYVVIGQCPWCAKSLPSSLGDKYFELLRNEYGSEVDILSIKDNPNILEEFKSDEWWKKRNL